VETGSEDDELSFLPFEERGALAYEVVASLSHNNSSKLKAGCLRCCVLFDNTYKYVMVGIINGTFRLKAKMF
jgi:hypothetical protein